MANEPENHWIGENTRRVRKQQSLTQQKLAEKAGVSVHYISAIERGGQAPSVTTLGRLAKALKVGVAELLKESGAQSDFDRLLDELNNLLRSQTKTEDVRFLIDVMKAKLSHYQAEDDEAGPADDGPG